MTTPKSTNNNDIDIDIEKPLVDQRQYKHFTIYKTTTNEEKATQEQEEEEEEGLDVLIISDPNTDKASGSVDIHIGQLNDTLEGIAHFCEHMLFIGTKKYPKENEYSEYLTKHGGISNAYTDLDHTNYHFDVAVNNTNSNSNTDDNNNNSNTSSNTTTTTNVLDKALDLFAQFFISPLFTQSAITREVQAIQNEFSKFQYQDNWRLLQLSKFLLIHKDATHTYNKFGVGNNISLPTNKNNKNKKEEENTTSTKNDDNDNNNNKVEEDDKEVVEDTYLRDCVVEFYNTYYKKSISLYKLVVLGKESLDELEIMVRKYFTELVNIKFSQSNISKSKLLNELYPTILSNDILNIPQYVTIIPITSTNTIEIQFPIRETLTLYKTKPSRYISHLIGHEGSGSLLSLLKEYSYVSELYCDCMSKEYINFSIFTIHMECTIDGIINLHKVLHIIFSYIDLLKHNGPQLYIQKELQITNDIQFKFLSQRNPFDYCRTLSNWMHYYPKQHILSGPYKIFTTEEEKQQQQQQQQEGDNNNNNNNNIDDDKSFEPELITELLSYLTPQNMLLMVSSPTFDTNDDDKEESTTTTTTTTTKEEEGKGKEEETTNGNKNKKKKVEQWFGTKYEELTFTKEIIMDDENETKKTINLLEYWTNANCNEYPKLQLPKPNDMIATDFTLKHNKCNNNKTNENEEEEKEKEKESIETTTTTTTTTIEPPKCILSKDYTNNNNNEDSNNTTTTASFIQSIQCWYKPDKTFQQPKVNILLHFKTPYAYLTSPLHLVYTRLYVELIEEICNEFSYEASMAGLDYHISNTTTGLEVSISGYNHKAYVLLSKVIYNMFHFISNSSSSTDNNNNNNETILFNRIHDKLMKQYTSFILGGQTYQHAMVNNDLLIDNVYWTIYDKINSLKKIKSINEIKEFLKSCFFHDSMQIECLIHGNVTITETKNIITMILNQCNLYSSSIINTTTTTTTTNNNNNKEKDEKENEDSTTTTTTTSTIVGDNNNCMIGAGHSHVERRVIQLVSGNSNNNNNDDDITNNQLFNNMTSTLPTTYIYEMKEYNESTSNSAIHNIYQIGCLSNKLILNAYLAIVQQLIRESAFDQLRTKEQLGYIVHTSIKTSGNDCKSLLFLIQSDTYNPIYLNNRIELFLKLTRKRILNMSIIEFNNYKSAVISNFLEKDKNLSEESSRYWHVIINQSYHFTRLIDIANYISNDTIMTKQHILQFFDKYISSTAPYRRKLSIQVFAKQHIQYMKQNENIENENTTTTNDNNDTNTNKEQEGGEGVNDDDNNNNNNMNDKDREVIQYITDPIEFKRSMPLFPLPKRVEVSVVEDDK